MATETRGRVLIVDDEENILNSLKGVLEDEGHEVLLAHHGEEALSLLPTERPDVVLLDVWMPGMDGMEVLKHVRAAHPDLQVIMITGHGTIETAVLATKIGAFDFFEKPLSVPAVTAAVDRALAHRRLLVENRQLRVQQMRPHALVGQSEAMAAARAELARLGPLADAVVCLGERGVGKKLCARLLHLSSPRRDRPFVVLAVHAHPAETLERELLGGGGEPGALSRAGTGTLYVEGAHRLPAPLLARLLEAAGRPHAPRLVLGWEGADPPAGLASLGLPPLRERPEDIAPLARLFLDELGKEHGSPGKSPDDDVLRAFTAYAWPSNVEELKNVVERLVLLSPGETLRLEDLPMVIQRAAQGPVPSGVEAPRTDDEVSFEEAERVWERRFLEQTLARHDGDLARAARQLRLSPELLRRKLQGAGLASRPTLSGRPQRTIAQSVVLAGVGLHSGGKTGLILNPLPPDSGILFGSVSHGDTVPAHVDFVEKTGYATGLRRGKAVARTIEHLMATLHAYGITNLLVKIADEVPIMDGSAQDFCQILEDGGVVDQDATVPEIRIDRTLTVGHPDDPDGEGMVLEPADAFEVSYDLVYDRPVGHQHFDWRLADAASFRDLIAPARTFGFLKDIAMLEEMGLASGGRLSNFILIDDEKVVNTELRFPDELVRHKILDITGDFYLLGRPVIGRIRARKTGHADNVAMLRLVQATYPELAPARA